MALRFPGADTPDGYWRDIRAGVTHVRRFTDAELAAAGFAPRSTARLTSWPRAPRCPASTASTRPSSG
ncbi:hypothetical protein O1M63_15670 [Streptomyces mirabilis]|nr:hypothetical protein [Streptomyces mirabilis]